MDTHVSPQTMADPVAWATTTFGTAALGDQRRTRGVVATAARLAADPDRSLPAAVRDPAALKATYRLLHGPAVDVAALVAPQQQATLTAARHTPVVLLVQDTTEVDYTAHRAATGLGPIGNGRGRGYLLQSVLALTPMPRQVLGVAYLEPFLRVPAPRPDERSDERRRRPRESDVWARAVAVIGAPPLDSRWVHVADAGADVFTFFQEAHTTGADLLVRAVQDRRAATPRARSRICGRPPRTCHPRRPEHWTSRPSPGAPPAPPRWPWPGRRSRSNRRPGWPARGCRSGWCAPGNLPPRRRWPNRWSGCWSPPCPWTGSRPPGNGWTGTPAAGWWRSTIAASRRAAA